MAEKTTKNIYLLFGDCDYHIFRELKDIKKKAKDAGQEVQELYGSEIADFNQIVNALESSDLFQSSNVVIIRDISNGKSFFPFVEKLTEYLVKTPVENNLLYITNYGKVLKTSKIFKVLSKVGEVKEFLQPKTEEIIKDIKKSLVINNDGALLLAQCAQFNLFQISSEIQKLRNYLLSSKKKEVTVGDINELCIKSFSQNEIWGIGSKFLQYKTETSQLQGKSPSHDLNALHLDLIREVNDLIEINTQPMQIFYSFYQYVLNAIKMKEMIKRGKSFRDLMPLGYFFVKEFFDKRNQLDLDYLLKLNLELLELEYKIKTGQINDILAIKELLVH